MRRVVVQADAFDLADEAAVLCRGRTDVGGLVTFTGLCRDEAGTLAALELEHFPGMAEAEIARIASVAEQRWPLLGITVFHRFGRIAPGEPIVLVATAARHRAAAFDAAAFVMDFLKTDAPFWKREHRTDVRQDPRATGAWVGAKAADGQATDRWQTGRSWEEPSL